MVILDGIYFRMVLFKIMTGLFLGCCLQDTYGQIASSVEEESGIPVRIVNHTDCIFRQVALLSTRFGDLRPNDTTEYRRVKYNVLKDDPLIYATVDGQHVGRYVKIPEEESKQYTYVIDSLKNKVIYVSRIEIDN
jgi:hypothetical protein